MSSVLTLTDDWAFIDDVYDDWTNGIMTRGTGLVTNSWTNEALTCVLD